MNKCRNCPLYKVILRARPAFQGKPSMDNVRLMVEEDNERIRTYFGKCLAFFEDANSNVTKCYQKKLGNVTFNVTVKRS